MQTFVKVRAKTTAKTATKCDAALVKEPSDENNAKLLQISSSEKSRPVFSFQKFAKTSHPSGGVDLPRSLHTFGGTDFFGHMSKKGWSQSTQLANIWKSLHRITRP